MTINFDKTDFEYLWVDRDSTLHDHGAQGFDVSIGGADIHFEDERDAVTLAKAILQRMGELP